MTLQLKQTAREFSRENSPLREKVLLNVIGENWMHSGLNSQVKVTGRKWRTTEELGISRAASNDVIFILRKGILI